MAGSAPYKTLDFTSTFLKDLTAIARTDQRRIIRALDLLDANEQHPSLHVHELKGPLAGVWSVSASDSLRITFERLDTGRKVLLTCDHHYGD